LWGYIHQKLLPYGQGGKSFVLATEAKQMDRINEKEVMKQKLYTAYGNRITDSTV